MKSTSPCDICGNEDLNLIDGFYYCTECGTQDVTVRETVVESIILHDGNFAQTYKKKIQTAENDNVEMSGEWYKWHAYNFILVGLADDLIKLGAKPSFKIKLLWIWTRYIKKYQNKTELGLIETDEKSNLTIEQHADDSEEELVEKPSRYQQLNDCRFRRIDFVTPLLICSMVYLALNLDKSEIQLSHLITFFKERRINFFDLTKYIPPDIKWKKVPHWKIFSRGQLNHVMYSTLRVRILAFTLCKKLNLGLPVIPDIRELVKNYTTELSLPDEFREIVYSLLHYYPCDDLSSIGSKTNAIPDYEGVTMAYVLMSLKVCFGLDDDYEFRISDVVDRINNKDNYLKCFNSDFVFSDRLFSFREWLNYVQFRKKILLQNCLLTDTEHYNDIDCYTYLEYVGKSATNTKMSLEDEITLEILNKIPLDDLEVTPKDLFVASLTPMASYAKILGENHNDTKVREHISEDFTKYSLKYICEDFSLKNDSSNILVGINSNIIETNEDILINDSEKTDIEMVFVKNCDNKNWLQTKPPLINHVTVIPKEGEDNNSDLGYDSHGDSTSDKDTNDVSDIKFQTIEEEDVDVNIFDDDFREIYYKEEEEAAANEDAEEPLDENHVVNNNEPIFTDEEDDNFYSDSEFNPETFNRERAIKELVLMACKKYKIPIPQEYRPEKVVVKRKLIRDEVGVSTEPKSKVSKRSKPGEVKEEVNNILNSYYDHVRDDVFNQISAKVQEAINNANQTKEEIKDVDDDNQEFDTCPDVNTEELNAETNNVTEIEKTEVEDLENIENSLFKDDNNDQEKLDETIIENDPKFDEKIFNTEQLYLKVKEESIEEELNFLEIIKEPEIKSIIERKIEESKNKSVFKQKYIKKEEFDFDEADDLPLSVLKEEMLYKEELKARKRKAVERLIQNIDIPEYKYWLKIYDRVFMSKVKHAEYKFDNAIREGMPKTFRFILSECAGITNCTPFQLYKCTQNLELGIMSKAGLIDD